MIDKNDVAVIIPAPSIPADQAKPPENTIHPKPSGEGAVEIYCTVCGQAATDGLFTHYGPNMQWWHTIAGTLDEIQWVYQTDRNYWDKVIARTVRCGWPAARLPAIP